MGRISFRAVQSCFCFFLLFFFGKHHYLHYSTKKPWCFNANILLRTPFRGRMCWKGNSGPVGCFFCPSLLHVCSRGQFCLAQAASNIRSTIRSSQRPTEGANLSTLKISQRTFLHMKEARWAAIAIFWPLHPYHITAGKNYQIQPRQPLTSLFV